MNKKGIDVRPQNFFAFLTSESESPKKWCAIAHENRGNEAYARFGACLTYKMGRTGHEVKPDA